MPLSFLDRFSWKSYLLPCQRFACGVISSVSRHIIIYCNYVVTDRFQGNQLRKIEPLARSRLGDTVAERTSCSEYLTESIGKFLPDVRAPIDYFRVCLASTLLLFPIWVSVKSLIYVTLDGTRTVSLSTSTMLIAVDSIKNVARFEGTALLKGEK